MPQKMITVVGAAIVLVASCGPAGNSSNEMSKKNDVTGADEFCINNPQVASLSLSEEELWSNYSHFSLCEGDIEIASSYIDVLIDIGSGEAMFIKANALWDSDREKSLLLMNRAADLGVKDAKQALERVKNGGRP